MVKNDLPHRLIKREVRHVERIQHRTFPKLQSQFCRGHVRLPRPHHRMSRRAMPLCASSREWRSQSSTCRSANPGEWDGHFVDTGHAINIGFTGKRNSLVATVIAVATALALGGCFAQLETQQAQIESQIVSQQREIERQAREIEQLKALLAQDTQTRRRIPTTQSLRTTVGSRPIRQQQEGEQRRLQIEDLSE